LNDIIYIPLSKIENFKLIKEKERPEKFNTPHIKIRLLTNQAIKINYDKQNLTERKVEVKSKMREINFFGLLLRVSKDFLTPTHDVILHIHGGGFSSQSSESHLTYLKEYNIFITILDGRITLTLL
jgi:hypothetical protein